MAKKNPAIGVGIISWNRPDYLKQTVASLEKNSLNGMEFHLFQDGAYCRFTSEKRANLRDIKKSVKIFSQSRLPRKHIHWRKENVSIAINQFEAMRYLCSLYDKFIFMENDVLVSENFMDLAKVVLEQYANDKEVACVSPGFRLKCERDKVDEYADALLESDGHFWVEMCWADKWQRVEEKYMNYYRLVKDVPYGKRRHAEINKLFELTGCPRPTTSQDNGKDWAIKQAGMKRLRFVVNRATGIGDCGFHSTPEKLARSGDGHNSIYSSDEDLKIKQFRII